MKVKRKYLFFFMLALPLLSFSQKVDNIHFEQEDQKIYIYYDLQGEQDYYNIEIFCKLSEKKSWGKSLNFVSGDVGQNRTPGSNKKIRWDVLREWDDLKGNIVFKIEATPTFKTYKSSFLPVFIPGARIKHYPGGKTKGIIKAVAFYGLVGSSVLLKLASNKQYDLYHQATTQEDMDKYYNSANTYYQAFQLTLYSGIAIWAIDMILQGTRGFKPVNNRVAMGYDPVINSMYLTYIHKF